MPDTGSTELALPDMRWSCLRCGRSCEDWSEVTIDAPTAERLRRLPLFSPGLAGGADGALPYRVDGRYPGQILLRFVERPNGASACVFLDDAGLCAIHAGHGEDRKPEPCRSFPFFFVETPDGVRTALSFACTAVLHDHGEPVTSQLEAVRERERFASHRERRGTGILLAPGTPIAWRSYVDLAARLTDLLATSDLVQALVDQANLLRREAGLTDLDCRPAPALARATRMALEELSGTPRHFAPPFAGPLPPDPARLLRRWVTHRLWRHDLLRGGEVLFAHSLLLAETALACRWASEHEGDLAESVAQIERGLGTHSDLPARLERDPGAREQLRRLFASPRYAASVAAEVVTDRVPRLSKIATAR